MEQALGRLTRDLAIDLGTTSTLVYAQGRGVVLDEPSVVATRRGPSGGFGEVLAVGDAAHNMLGRTPEGIVVRRPLAHGVIGDFQLAEEMLRTFIRWSAGRTAVVKPRALVCVPSGLSEVERRAVHESTRAAGCREVQLISQPVAAALGAGLPIFEPRGCMIVDIGGGTTEIAVMSLGGLVVSRSLRTAGSSFDAAIIEMLKRDQDLEIGERSAEALKRELGSAVPAALPQRRSVKGRTLSTGRPKEISLTGEELRQALLAPLAEIVEVIREVLSETPPELAGDVLELGIVLCGGGALLPGLDEYLREATRLPVVLAEHPLRAVIHGAGAAVENPDLLPRLMLR
ncbi:MAG: rod shape-determining protein [Alphaproteobacteria bacterium]|nr:rod shape-determining protein [Alphaproteobacteria bacterium]